MNVEDTMLSEISQSERDKYSVFPPIRETRIVKFRDRK